MKKGAKQVMPLEEKEKEEEEEGVKEEKGLVVPLKEDRKEKLEKEEQELGEEKGLQGKVSDKREEKGTGIKERQWRASGR